MVWGNVRSVRYPPGEMSSGNCPSGKSPSWKCPSGKCPKTAVYMSPNKCSYAGGKYLLKSFSGWGADSNIIKISCHNRLFSVLHLLVNSVIVMTIARKAVECVSILIQFFSYLRKQRWLFTCPWLWQKIISYKNIWWKM